MATVASPRHYTVEEYLAFDRASEFKHEYRLESVGCDVPLAAIYAHVARLGEAPGGV